MNRDVKIEEMLADMQILQRSWKASLFKLLGDDDISPMQTGVLFYIKNNQPVSGKSIAKDMHISPSSVAQFTDGLDSMKLIERKQDPHDRRILYLSLTAKGKKKIDQIELKRNQFFKRLTTNLSDEDIEAMQRVHKKMVSELEIYKKENK